MRDGIRIIKFCHQIHHLTYYHKRITNLNASAMRCVAELQQNEQACQESMLGELSYLLSGARKRLHNCEEKWRQVFIHHKPESSALVRFRKRELWGLTHDRFIVESVSEQLMRVESRPKEGLTFAQRPDFGVDDGDDLTVTIMSRTILDDKTETAGVVAQPNGESMECAQTYGASLCGRVKAPRVETDSDHVGCALTRKHMTCWTQGVRSFG